MTANGCRTTGHTYASTGERVCVYCGAIDEMNPRNDPPADRDLRRNTISQLVGMRERVKVHDEGVAAATAILGRKAETCTDLAHALSVVVDKIRGFRRSLGADPGRVSKSLESLIELADRFDVSDVEQETT